MLYTPKRIHYGIGDPERSAPLPERFGVLVWNVNKSRRLREMQRLFAEWEREWNLQLLLLQEGRLHPGKPFLLPGFSYDFAANLQTATDCFGVLTAAKVPSSNTQAFLSEGREAFLGTRKSFLLTNYPLAQGGTLLCLNLHAINFRETERYRKEIEEIKRRLEAHEGAMIVAGDFNSWNPSRHRILKEFARELGLERLEIEEGVKKFRGHPLDLIYYRGVVPLRSRVLSTEGLSDHNPILAEFECPKRS